MKRIVLCSIPYFHSISQILSGLKKSGMLHDLITEYIDPLALYDREKNGQLMKTLKVYQAQSGSKQDTARELFVVGRRCTIGWTK